MMRILIFKSPVSKVPLDPIGNATAMMIIFIFFIYDSKVPLDPIGDAEGA